jgi:RNA polymerase sigma-70 factor (ECF subfamily)
MAEAIPYRHHGEMQDGHVKALYEAHAGGVFAFLAYRTGDRALAEDLLADTFERVIRTRRRPVRADKAWLYTVALNVLRDHARRARVEERALADSHASTPASAVAGADAVADRDAVMRAVRTLSDEEQEAIALRFGAGLTVPEIAAATGEPLPRTEGRVYRALRKLRPLLEREYSR